MSSSHTPLAKTLHWGFVGLYAYGMFKQLDDLSQLEDAALLQFEVLFASVFLLIVILRYLYMRRFETFLGAREPAAPGHKRLARAVHLSMYLCLASLPLSGLLIAGLYANGVKGGLLQGVVVEMHEFFASLSYLLIGIHVAAALLSRLHGEGVWSSMVPVFKERERGGPR